METNFLIFDIYWTFVLPSICLFSFLTNVFNVIITYVLRKKSVVYKYMFLNSVTNLAYLFIMFFVFLIKCGQLCDNLKDSYIAKFYHHYFFFFIGNSLGLIGLFMEILISLQRIFYIKNITIFLRDSSINILLLCLVIFSLALYSPNLFFNKINAYPIKDNDKIIYKREPTDYYKHNSSVKIFIGVAQGLRLVLVLVLIVSLNFLTFRFFKKRIVKKKVVVKENESSID